MVEAASVKSAVDAAIAALAREARGRVPGSLGDGIAYAMTGEGKRIRGRLLLAAYRAVGGRGDAAPLAAAVEAVHAYSLVHDDLPCMDDDALRRGRPTVHVAFSVPMATVVGLAMIPLAARAAFRAAIALGLSQDAAAGVAQRLMEASGAHGMVGGQARDLEAEGRQISLEELKNIHLGKTASLIEASVAIGGLGGGGTRAQISALERFGRNVGLAFQIADDVLDVTATSEELGKTAGRDLDLQKSTYPALLGLEEARRMAEELAGRALRALDEAGLDASELRELAEFAVRRRR